MNITEVKKYLEGRYVFPKIQETLPNGNIYEFGVYGGLSLKYLLTTLIKAKIPFTNVFGFDSFEGLPSETNNISILGEWTKGNFNIQQLFNTNDVNHIIFLITKMLKKHTKFNNIHIIKTWYDQLSAEDVKKYNMTWASYINIDCDLYTSAYTALDFMFENQLVVTGTIIRFDDWYKIANNMGERLAYQQIKEKYQVVDKLVHHEHIFKIIKYDQNIHHSISR